MIKEAQYGRTRTIVCMYVCQRGSKIKSQYNEWSIESGDWYLTGAARWSRKGGIPVPEVCDGGSFIHSKWPGNSPWHHRTPNFGEFTLSVGLCVAHLECRNAEMTERTSSPQQNVRMCDTRITCSKPTALVPQSHHRRTSIHHPPIICCTCVDLVGADWHIHREHHIRWGILQLIEWSLVTNTSMCFTYYE